MRKLTNLLLFISLISVGHLKAQENVYTTGGNATGSGGTIEYSIGQLTFDEISDGTFTVSQGIQQPFEIMSTLSVENPEMIKLELSVFPNPTANELTLSFNKGNSIDYTYHLYDINGRVLQTKNKLKLNETIPMKNLGSALYYLKISDNKQLIKTFKIIKN